MKESKWQIDASLILYEDDSVQRQFWAKTTMYEEALYYLHFKFVNRFYTVIRVIFARSHLCVESSLRGVIFAQSCLCTQIPLHGVPLDWSHLCTQSHLNAVTFACSCFFMQLPLHRVAFAPSRLNHPLSSPLISQSINQLVY